MIKYFHKLTEDEFKEIVKEKITWAKCGGLYPQPKWCSYPDAVRGVMGCWSLMEHMVTGKRYCRSCDCLIK